MQTDYQLLIFLLWAKGATMKLKEMLDPSPWAIHLCDLLGLLLVLEAFDYKNAKSTEPWPRKTDKACLYRWGRDDGELIASAE